MKDKKVIKQYTYRVKSEERVQFEINKKVLKIEYYNTIKEYLNK